MEFALIGDGPYESSTVSKFEQMIERINAERKVRWVLHVGDTVKGGDCSDALFESRFALFQRIRRAFVVTPGDNDWIDCNGSGSDPLERLAFFRRLYYPDPDRTTGGRPMAVRSQSDEPGFEDFVENVLWIRSGVVFSTLHAIALNSLPDPLPDETARRNAAMLAWIAETFRVAEELDSPGVFMAMQVDPWLLTGLPAVAQSLCPECLEPRGGIEPLYPALQEAVLEFGRPVVLAVGDTHFFRVDKPLLSPTNPLDTLENFTRVEAFGNPDVHWVRVRVVPNDDGVFSFKQEIIEENRVTP